MAATATPHTTTAQLPGLQYPGTHATSLLISWLWPRTSSTACCGRVHPHVPRAHGRPTSISCPRRTAVGDFIEIARSDRSQNPLQIPSPLHTGLSKSHFWAHRLVENWTSWLRIIRFLSIRKTSTRLQLTHLPVFSNSLPGIWTWETPPKRISVSWMRS